MHLTHGPKVYNFTIQNTRNGILVGPILLFPHEWFTTQTYHVIYTHEILTCEWYITIDIVFYMEIYHMNGICTNTYTSS